MTEREPVVLNNVVYYADELIASWVAKRLDEPFVFPSTMKALGVLDEDRNIIAGVTYDRWNGVNVECGIAAVPGSQWASRGALHALFHYPFIAGNHTRITCLVRERNMKSWKMLMQMGFTPEATLKAAAHDGSDMTVWRMFREDCPWLAEGEYGEGITAETA